MDLTQSYETYGISSKGRSRRDGNGVFDAHSSEDLTIGCVADTLKLMLNQSTVIDRVFQALADPSRRGMVDRLCQGPASVSELAEPLSMSLAGVVQHLQVLEVSGLIRSEKVGRVRTCRIEPVALGAAERWIAQRRSMWESRLDRLGALLDEDDVTSNQEPTTLEEE
jgi:DNA-binding transcriptional ArsR family regulator